MSMYELLKDVHNILRWAVLLTAVWALVKIWGGLLTRSPWTKSHRIAGLIFTTLLNVQFLIGIALLFTSPLIRSAMSNMKLAMGDSMLRFFLVEHPFMMLLAVVIAQIGFSLAKRAPTDRAKFLKSGIAYTIATILILAAIPWPFLKYGRPLFPSFG